MKKYNNYSKEHKKYLQKKYDKTFFVVFLQIGIIAVLFVLWEVLTKKKLLDPFFVSSPSRIWNMIKILYQSGQLFMHMRVTLVETILAFLIATGTGFVIAFLLWLSEFFRRVFEPYIVVLNSLPKIALGPLIIIWMGAGNQAIIMMAFLIIVFTTIMSILSAFIACDKNLIAMCKSMGANNFQIFFKVVLPNALPDIVTVLKINVGLSWIGAIMGEYLVSRAGLGYLLIYGAQVIDLTQVITSIALISILACTMYFVVAIFEKVLKK